MAKSPLPDLLRLRRLRSPRDRDRDLVLSRRPRLRLRLRWPRCCSRDRDLLRPASDLRGGVEPRLPDRLRVRDLLRLRLRLRYLFLSSGLRTSLLSGTLCSGSGELSLLMLSSGVGDFCRMPASMSSCFFLIAACLSLLHSYSPSLSHPSGSLHKDNKCHFSALEVRYVQLPWSLVARARVEQLHGGHQPVIGRLRRRQPDEVRVQWLVPALL